MGYKRNVEKFYNKPYINKVVGSWYQLYKR